MATFILTWHIPIPSENVAQYKGLVVLPQPLFTRDKTWICGIIWLAGLVNRASNPAMTDPVNLYTMSYCLAVYSTVEKGTT